MPDTVERDRTVERWNSLWSLLPFVFLAVPAAVSLTNGVRPLALGLVVLLALWYWGLLFTHEDWWERLSVTLLYYAGLLAGTAVLVHLDPAFQLLVMGCFLQAFMILPGRWAYVGVAAASVLPWLNVGVEYLGWSTLPNALLSFGLTAAIGGTIRAVHAQNDRRKEIITELEETSRRLAASAEENSQLQAQLVRQAKEAGVHAERQRLAREIHDTLAQGLIGIITHLQAAEQVVEDAERTRPMLGTAQRMARDSLAEARRSVQALRPAPLSDAKLPEALGKVTDAWSREHGVPASLTVTGERRPLHPEVEVVLLRTAQEALSNVARHARAGRAGMTLSYMEDVVALDVRDDGVGFDPVEQRAARPDAAGGFGLTAMRQRVTRIAGSLSVESSPGQGTGLSATVPAIPPAETAEAVLPPAPTAADESVRR